MGFGQITVITLVVVIQGSFVGRQKAFGFHSLMCRVEFSMAAAIKDAEWIQDFLLCVRNARDAGDGVSETLVLQIR